MVSLAMLSLACGGIAEEGPTHYAADGESRPSRQGESNHDEPDHTAEVDPAFGEAAPEPVCECDVDASEHSIFLEDVRSGQYFNFDQGADPRLMADTTCGLNDPPNALVDGCGNYVSTACDGEGNCIQLSVRSGQVEMYLYTNELDSLRALGGGQLASIDDVLGDASSAEVQAGFSFFENGQPIYRGAYTLCATRLNETCR